jgi:hypothetical protein
MVIPAFPSCVCVLCRDLRTKPTSLRRMATTTRSASSAGRANEFPRSNSRKSRWGGPQNLARLLCIHPTGFTTTRFDTTRVHHVRCVFVHPIWCAQKHTGHDAPLWCRSYWLKSTLIIASDRLISKPPLPRRRASGSNWCRFRTKRGCRPILRSRGRQPKS